MIDIDRRPQFRKFHGSLHLLKSQSMELTHKTYSPPPIESTLIRIDDHTLSSLLSSLLRYFFLIIPMNCHVLSLFFVLSSVVVIGEGATATYVPTDIFLFNCGDSPDNNDDSGRKWSMENRTTFASNPADASFTSVASFQASGVTQVPYMTARIFRSNFTYSFPVTQGQKFVRLYFYPANYGSKFDAVNSFFSVTANGFTLLKNFSADLTVKGSTPEQAYLIKEFIVPVDQTLNLTFSPSRNSLGFVNGIEIVSMPDRFYTKGGFDDNIKSVDGGNADTYTIDNTTALETVYRVNIGGQMINEVGDSGMFRRWLDENVFLLGNSGVVPNLSSLDIKINYTEKTPAYVAPDSVYATCRVMGNPYHPKLNLNFNLTWLFTVDANFTYIVRLHFCEIRQDVNQPVQCIFSIFIKNQFAMDQVDVITMSGGSEIPMYLDFSIYVKSGPLQVDLCPSADYTIKYYEAILNGVEILKLNNSEGNLAGPNPNSPVSADSPSNSEKLSTGNGNKSHILPIIFAVIGSAIALAMVVVVVVVLMKKKSNESSVYTTSKPITDSSWGPLLHGTSASTNTRSTTSLPSDLCRRFTIFEIKTATNNFDDNLIVGKGGFGTVYKGRIDDGTKIVAVKRLDITSSQGAKEFETELKMLSMLRHLHLVSLIGYCDDEYEMVLVYEYMPHGTLRDHLYKRDKASVPPLSWKRRLEICIGAARGIQYLHTGTKHTIIHRDIKTTNILLDENFVAKVADFGLSKVGPTSASQTHVSTVVKGTSGYLDPEYYRRQVLTDKSDVYSFGVVLFEVMCSRPTLKIQNGQPEQADLVRWAKFSHKTGTIDQIIDTDLAGDISSTSLEKYCEIAIRCVKDRGIERPSMNDVVWALEFALQLHEPAQKKNENVDSQAVMPRGEIGTATDGDDDLISRTTELVPISTTTDESAPRVGDEESGSSWGVFSEIKDPKAR